MPARVDTSLRKLVMAAEKDPALLAKLCEEPEVVAKEFGVSLAAAEVAQLKRVGRLHKLLEEFTEARIPDPIYYPIDLWWTGELADHILHYHIFYPMRYRIIDALKYHLVGPIFYPAEEMDIGAGALRQRTRRIR